MVFVKTFKYNGTNKKNLLLKSVHWKDIYLADY